MVNVYEINLIWHFCVFTHNWHYKVEDIYTERQGKGCIVNFALFFFQGTGYLSVLFKKVSKYFGVLFRSDMKMERGMDRWLVLQTQHGTIMVKKELNTK